MSEAVPGWGFAAGTFGELVQGEIDGTPFLITLPILWGTRATFLASSDGRIEVWPAHRKKARKAAELALAEVGKPQGGRLIVQSTLPVGKGMASSSADIVASIRAVAAYYRCDLTPAQIGGWAAQIEPSDGIMYPGVTAFDPLQGRLLERLGPVPPAMILGVLGHGRINTEDHHRHRIPYQADHQDRLKQALQYARQGVRRRDVALLGRAGRLSAEVEYERGPDSSLRQILDIADDEKLGVIIAHSGTVRGLLLPMPVSGIVIRRLEQRLWTMDAGPVYRIQVGAPPLASLSGKEVWRGMRNSSLSPDFRVP